MKSILITGFGRMGITHLAHLNALTNFECKFDIIDTSKAFKLMSHFNLRKNIKFLPAFPEGKSYDAVFITTPPQIHGKNFDDVFSLSDVFFIEKPLQLSQHQIEKARESGKLIYCGYVLRNSPCIEYIKNALAGNTPDKIRVSVDSNLGLQDGEDWRYDLTKGGGCLNELGSHAINLALAVTETDPQKQPEVIVNELSTGTFSLELTGNSRVEVVGDWNKNVRKTSYEIQVESNDTKWTSDLQNVTILKQGMEPVSWSPREDALDAGFYLRGVDFAVQAKRFLEKEISPENVIDAWLTDKVIEEVISK